MTNPEIIGNKQDQGLDQAKSEVPLDLDIPGYRIIGQCGGGGTAKVYVALQKALGRQVAIKVMHTALSSNKLQTDRFIKEGLVNAKLYHPNIVTVHDVAETDGCHYITMEYLPWGSLRRHLTARLELGWILDVVEQIASALAYAHENGFVHRDIKPENILFRNKDSAVLTDFGIATVIDSHIQVTDRSNYGTPRYMSPEQIELGTVGPSSDVYSLGIVLFEMLSGMPPYNEGDSKSIRNAHIQNPIPNLPEKCKYLQPLINKMLAKQVKDRISNANEVVNILTYLKQTGQLPQSLTDTNINFSTVKPIEVATDHYSENFDELTDVQIIKKHTEIEAEFDNNRQPTSELYEEETISSIEGFGDDVHPYIGNDVRALKTGSSSGEGDTGLFTKLRINFRKFIPSLGAAAALSVILGLASLILFLVHLNETPKVKNQNYAQQNIQIIHDRYMSWAVHYLKNNELKRAKYYIEKARDLKPDNLINQELLDSLGQDKLTEDQFKEINASFNVTNKFISDSAPVSELLVTAEHQIQNNNLTIPPNNNAFDTYKLILKSDPNNTDAITGISIIKKSYIAWAEHDLKKNNYQRAVLFYKKALAIDPNDTKLVKLIEVL